LNRASLLIEHRDWQRHLSTYGVMGDWAKPLIFEEVAQARGKRENGGTELRVGRR